MRVFVAGASGVIGRSLVGMFIDAGHEVTGMTRSPNKAKRELGWTPAYASRRDGFRAAAG